MHEKAVQVAQSPTYHAHQIATAEASCAESGQVLPARAYLLPHEANWESFCTKLAMAPFSSHVADTHSYSDSTAP